MRGSDDEADAVARWEPSYIVWAVSILISTVLAGFLASKMTSAIIFEVGGRAPGDLPLLEIPHIPMEPLWIVVAGMAAILASVPPGLLSLYLLAVTDRPLVQHPLIGAVFFGVAGGLLGQAWAIAILGFLFGLISLGGSAAILAIHRHLIESRRHG